MCSVPLQKGEQGPEGEGQWSSDHCVINTFLPARASSDGDGRLRRRELPAQPYFKSRGGFVKKSTEAVLALDGVLTLRAFHP